MARQTWGARPLDDTRWSFALWAPDASSVELELAGKALSAAPDGDGGWRVEAAAAADLPYRWMIDGTAYPDPQRARR
ncbi:hypothetical protein ACFSHP_26855 [Novosphingobium panipatense]